MLKYALICLALGVAASPSYALSRSTLESKETVRPASPRPWVISAEYAGRAGLYSLNLDAQFTPDWGVGGGLSVWNSAVFSKLNSAKFVIVPVYANYYWRLSGKHRIYSTLGASLVSLGGGTYPSFDSDVLRPFSAGGVVGTLGAGYEFRGSSGVLFRALPYWLARPGLSSFSAGLSLGYAF